MGHGKDTAGQILAKNLRHKGIKVFNLRFAMAVKQCASIMTGEELQITDNCSYDLPQLDFTREQKQKFLPVWEMTLGQFLQRFATEAVRDGLHEDAWIRTIQSTIESEKMNHLIGGNNAVFIITDFRFPNEKIWLNSVDAVTIKINRPFKEEKEKRETSHSSEKGLPDEEFDFVIQNNSTLDLFQEEIEKLSSVLNLFE